MFPVLNLCFLPSIFGLRTLTKYTKSVCVCVCVWQLLKVQVVFF